jgi:hypothetical protein
LLAQTSPRRTATLRADPPAICCMLRASVSPPHLSEWRPTGRGGRGSIKGVGLRQVLASCTRVGAKGGAEQMPWKTVDRGHDVDERVPYDHDVVPRHFSG